MTRRQFATASLAVALLAAVPLAGCKLRTPDTTPAGDTGDVKVAVTFPALYSLAANVVGDTGTVKSVKSTQGAHGSEVTVAELEVAASAEVLFANGLGLDSEFCKKLAAGASNSGLKVVYLGDLLNERKHSLMLHSDGPCLEGEEEHEHDGHDPHVWMGIDRVLRYVDYMSETLGEKYPAHKDTFYKNAEVYKEKLKAVKAEGQEVLAGTKRADRKIVTVHASMNYFADTFNITVVDYIQKVAGREPTKQELDALIANCQKEGVRVIATEPQYSKLGGVKTLAEEMKRQGVAVAVLELDNMETASQNDLSADWYEQRMRANIAALKGVFE